MSVSCLRHLAIRTNLSNTRYACMQSNKICNIHARFSYRMPRIRIILGSRCIRTSAGKGGSDGDCCKVRYLHSNDWQYDGNSKSSIVDGHQIFTFVRISEKRSGTGTCRLPWAAASKKRFRANPKIIIFLALAFTSILLRPIFMVGR